MNHPPFEPEDDGPAGDDPPRLGDGDPLVEECLRDALGPYIAVLSPEELADYRAFLLLFITTHPAAAPLYERLKKRPVHASASGIVVRGGAPQENQGTIAGDGTCGGRR